MEDTEFVIVLLRARRVVLSTGKEVHTRNMITNLYRDKSICIFMCFHNGISHFHLGAELSCCCQAFSILPVLSLKKISISTPTLANPSERGKLNEALPLNTKASSFSN